LVHARLSYSRLPSCPHSSVVDDYVDCSQAIRRAART
jgi:hypothetical protein